MIDLETESRPYRIECLGGNAISISGHPEYCPEPVSARLQGSVDKQGILESGVIVRGMYLRFVVNERRPITTTRVVRLRVDQPEPLRKPSASIH